MSNRSEAFIDALNERVDAIADACTACGACARVCPTLAVNGLANASPEELTHGVREILSGKAASEASEQWARTCCSSGACLTACEHGINPRFMLTMARRAMSQHDPEPERRTTGKTAFQKMSRGVRVLSRLTLPPELHERLSPRSHPDRTTPPDIVFYTGCNMLKTPHIGLLCLDVLDRLGITYEVQGGPGACCGILQTRPGDTENAGRQGFGTLDKFAEAKASQVVSWCPTCQIQFGETMIPAYKQVTGHSIDMDMFPVYLAGRLDQLKPMMTRPVNKRVALYEYAGELGVMEAVRALLSAIPGVEVIEIETSSIGYNNTSLVPLGRYHRDTLAAALSDAEAAGVDTMIGIYHGDHRELSGHEASWPFEMQNYMELVGESIGVSAVDRFKELKLMQDADAIVAASKAMIETHGLDVEQVRDVVVADMIGDQLLLVDRSRHGAS